MKKKPSNLWFKSPLLSACIVLGLSLHAGAANYEWQTAGTNDTWSTAGGDANWFIAGAGPLAAWADGNAAVFNATTDATVTVSGTVAPTAVTFGTGWANNFTLTGGTIAFGGATGSIDSSAVGTVGGRQLKILSAITGTAGLMINSHGDLTAGGGGNGAYLQLGGNNSGLTGGIAVTGGLIDLTAANSVGANTLTFSNGGGILNAQHGAIILTNPITVSTAGTVRTWSNSIFNLTGLISGSGTLAFTDGGVTTLGSATGAGGTAVNTAANTFGGKISVGGGKLGITGDSALGTPPASFQADNITISNNATFMNMSQATSATNFGAGFDVTLNANRGITLGTGGATFQIGYGKTFTVNGAITGVGNLTKPDGGTLVLNDAITYTGNTGVTGGTLTFNPPGNLTKGGTVTVAVGSALNWAPTGRTLTLSGTGNTFTGELRISGVGSTIDIGANNVTFNGAGGTGLRYAAASGTGTVNATGGGKLILGTTGVAPAGDDWGATNVNGTLLINAVIDGPAGKTYENYGGGAGGTTIFAVNNTYLGDTYVSDGTLQIGTGGTTGSIGAGVLGVNGGKTFAVNRADAVTLTQNVILVGAAGNSNFTVADGAAATDLTLSGVVSGTREFWKRGLGTLALTNSNTYTGSTVLVDGILDLNTLGNGATPGANGTGGIFIAQAGTPATLRYSGPTASTDKIGANALQGTGANTIIEIPNAATTLTITSPLGQNGAGKGFTKTGAGSLVLANDSTYTGPTVVNTGTLQLGNGGATGTLGGGAVTNNGKLVFNRSGITTVAGVISGSGSLEQTSGTLSLTGANTYTGETTVTGGTLSLANAFLDDASTVRIATGGVLDLQHGASDTVDKLFINGVQQAAGVYDSTNSGGFITGSGSLNVTGVPTDPYVAWASAKGLTSGVNDAKGDDPDHDGLNNLIEFAFDGNPLSGASDQRIFTKVATVNGSPALTLTLPVRVGTSFPPSVGELVSGPGSVIYHIQGSVDLVNWALDVDEVPAGDVAAVQAGIANPETGWINRSFYIPGSDPSGTPECFIRAKATE
ncbi:autotransporter-associated beta strand repeat-containing protein [Luteolibacter ambystomatis]|uniref:Autotransporter-associated beta strand repeat-containing protein n=1 Tax=Luteolibacter ambystomatis TaxID=2824561 RepID=A0A975G596_9BACT|nr:autotransporter-associated beta strand repeat-containing protein [Luteolibacter ambystomatis]QUE49344.1 autotransporter-associated beta strand repeat-containing protein [Luteolibacter ambystomatis]